MITFKLKLQIFTCHKYIETCNLRYKELKNSNNVNMKNSVRLSSNFLLEELLKIITTDLYIIFGEKFLFR